MLSFSLLRLFRRPLSGFEAVDSFKAAARMGEVGTLKKTLLIPAEAGGPDGQVNVVYLPPQAADRKAAIDKPILALVADGHEVHYNASPEYRGRSFVPCRLHIQTSGALVMEQTLEVW